MSRSDRRTAALASLALLLVAPLAGCGPAASAPPAAPQAGPAAPPPVPPAAAEPAPAEDAPPRPPAQIATSAPAEADLRVVAVEAPPFAHATPKRIKGTTVAGKDLLKLTKVSEKANAITDDAAWFEVNKLSLPALGEGLPGLSGPRPASVAASFRGLPFAIATRQADGSLLALYGPPGDGARFVVAIDPAGAPRFALDFQSFLKAPVTAPGDEAYVAQGVRWAEMAGGVLFVSSFHRTYAKSSGGKNAFVSAIDPETGTLRWQSAPLVANAANFLLWDGFIVSGYGFTAEPDHMVIIDQATGATLARTFVKSGPSYLVRKGDQLFVRTYDTDLVFGVD